MSGNGRPPKTRRSRRTRAVVRGPKPIIGRITRTQANLMDDEIQEAKSSITASISKIPPMPEWASGVIFTASCLRCGNSWAPRNQIRRPLRCPNCWDGYWSEPYIKRSRGKLWGSKGRIVPRQVEVTAEVQQSSDHHRRMISRAAKKAAKPEKVNESMSLDELALLDPLAAEEGEAE